MSNFKNVRMTDRQIIFLSQIFLRSLLLLLKIRERISKNRLVEKNQLSKNLIFTPVKYIMFLRLQKSLFPSINFSLAFGKKVIFLSANRRMIFYVSIRTWSIIPHHMFLKYFSAYFMLGYDK